MSGMSPNNEAIVPILVAAIEAGLLDNPDKIDEKLGIIFKAYNKIKEVVTGKSD